MASPQTPVVSPFVRRKRPRGLNRLFPILATLRGYKLTWLLSDIAAGIVLTAILVPVGMGYAAAHPACLPFTACMPPLFH